MAPSAVHVRSDSLLLVQQMRGVYRVKNEGLKPLYGQARLLAHRIGNVTFEHIRRELNAEADTLANRAMDEAEAGQVRGWKPEVRSGGLGRIRLGRPQEL